MATLNFLNSINVSAQVGDSLYCLGPNGITFTNNFQTSNEQPELFGTITSINNNTNIITYDEGSINTPTSLASPPVFVMFQKNQSVNTSGLKGYYAEVKFVNNSTEKAELFSVGAEVDESSK